MSKLRIGVYYDLPKGGAERVISGIVARLRATDYELFRLPHLIPSHNRLLRDFQNFVTTYLHAQKLKKLILANKLDLVLVSHDSFFAAPTILGISPVPTIFYCNEPTRALFESELGISKDWPFVNQLYEHLYRFIKRKCETNNARQASCTLSNSHYAQKYLINAYGISSSVVYPAVDTSFFYPDLDVSKEKSVLIVGNDEPQKRLALAIAAIADLPRSSRPLLHLVCPRSSPSPRFLNLAKRHGVRLKLHLNISNQDLRSLYQTSLLTLVTALAEPFGLSAAESLSCGTPVVAVNQGGVGEIVEDGRSGYLCAPNPREISQKIAYLLTHKKIAAEMGKQGRLEVERQFTWPKTMRGVNQAINSLTSSP